LFKHVTRTLALIGITCAVLSYSGAQSGSKTHQLKGDTFGYLLVDSFGDISGASYDGSITGFGKAQVSLGIYVANASPSLPYGRVLISKGGNQYLDQVVADLDGTSIDTGSGTLYFGTGVITGGNGKFAGATGTFSWTAELTGELGESLDNAVFSFDGSVTY
jgi:hypothetical protein